MNGLVKRLVVVLACLGSLCLGALLPPVSAGQSKGALVPTMEEHEALERRVAALEAGATSTTAPPTTVPPTTAPPPTTLPPPTTTTTTVAPTTTTAVPPDGSLLTDAGLRAALERGGEIRLPAGTVNITKPLRITQSGTKLIGAGRDATTLRMAFGPEAYGPLIALPAEWSMDFGGNPPPESMRVSNVEIGHLSIDGAREGNPNTYGTQRTNTLRFGVQSTVSTDTWLHDLRLYDIAGDAIGFGNGNGANERPKMERILIERAARNGIHLGHASDSVIRDSDILDTPGVYWENAGAGNGIDIEVEGHNPSVVRTTIEDNVISRPHNAGFAGVGIQISRAYGYTDDVLIRRNTFRNHQTAVLVFDTTAVRILDNRMESSPAGVNNVTGGGVSLFATPDFASGATVSGNTFDLEAWGGGCDNAISANGEGTWVVTDNTILGCVRTFLAYGGPSHIESANNRYRPLRNGLFFDNSLQPASTISDTGSVRLP